jgi:hypothetical protein
VTVTRGTVAGVVVNDNDQNTTNATFDVNYSSSGTSPVCTVSSNKGHSGDPIALDMGANVITVSCDNDFGPPATDSVTVTRGDAAGVVINTQPQHTTDATITIDYTPTGTAPVSCTVKNDDNVEGNPVTLHSGDNTITVSCTNVFGGPNSATVVITQDPLAVIPDTTITSLANPSAGLDTNNKGAPNTLDVQFTGTNVPTSFQCTVQPAANGGTYFKTLTAGDFNAMNWTNCGSMSDWSYDTSSLTGPAQYMYLIRAVNSAGADPSPAVGFFWRDTRPFNAAPTLEYYTNSLVTDQAATNDAGAHPTLGTNLAVEGSDDGQSIQLVMPDGLMGSLAAVPKAQRCTYQGFTTTETCPLTSKIGEISGSAIGAADGNVSAAGTVYLIDPSSLDGPPVVLPGAAAAAAVVIDDITAPISSNPGKILAVGGLYINDNGFNIRINIPNIPNETTTGLRFHITNAHLQLDGDKRPNMGAPASATNPALITNPSQCPLYDDGMGNMVGYMQDQGADRPDWYRFVGNGHGYYGSDTPTIKVDYPVDNCEGLGFNPQIATTTDPSPIVAGTETVTHDFKLTSTVTFNYGDSTLMSTLIYMPPYISVNLPGLGDALDQCANGTMVGSANGIFRFDPSVGRGCPAQARVGTAAIDSSLVEDTIKADVWLIESSPIPSIGLTVRDTTAGNPRGVNVGFVLKTDTPPADYPTSELLAPFGKSACTVRNMTTGTTNVRRVDSCRTAIQAQVNPGAVPDLPMDSLTLTLGNVTGRKDINNNDMSLPLRTATNTDKIACRIGGVNPAEDWLPPIGSITTPASSAFRMQLSGMFMGWNAGYAEQLNALPITGCDQ